MLIYRAYLLDASADGCLLGLRNKICGRKEVDNHEDGYCAARA
jgi:hypothetical protein